MSRSSGRRGQVEPLAALTAVAVLGLALGLYVGVFDATVPEPSDRAVEDAALLRTVAELRAGSVAVPARVEAATAAAPDGYRIRVTLRTANRTWRRGPQPPTDAAVAARTLPVRAAPDAVAPGRVRVEVWPWHEA